MGKDSDGILYVRITGNTGTGFFNPVWASLVAIEEKLSVPLKKDECLTSIVLFPIFHRRSVNTPAFVFAALVHEGVVEKIAGKRGYQYVGMDVMDKGMKGTDRDASE